MINNGVYEKAAGGQEVRRETMKTCYTPRDAVSCGA